MAHESGLPDYLAGRSPSSLPRKEEEALASVAAAPLEFATGTAFRYNQTNYLLLKRIIERVTGRGFVHEVTARMFQPLGLKRLRYGGEYDVIPDRANVYAATPAGLRVFGGSDFPQYAYSAAGLNGSAADLAAWMAALIDGKLISQATWNAMLQPRPTKDGAPPRYVNGLEYGRFGDVIAVGHGGGARVDVRHYFRASKRESVTVIYLSNGAERWVSPQDISARLADALLPGAVFPRQRLKEAMGEAIAADDFPRALAVYRAFRAAPETAAVPVEDLVNTVAS
jgi:CubicO group peptidase (beta-lactamase class C family)